MNTHLSLLLTRRYPELYGAAEKHGFPFEHGDGWFGLLDALSEVLVWRAAVERRPVQRAEQVKEKYGQIRFYSGVGEADDGAIELAEEMSGRLCEATGRPGRLGSSHGWWATRAPGLDNMQSAATRVGEDGRMGVPPLGLTVNDVRGWRADVLAPVATGSAGGILEVPKGWLDLIDGLLLVLSEPRTIFRMNTAGAIDVEPGLVVYDDVVPVRVDKVSVGSTGALRVDYVGGGSYAEGAVAMAVALSRRLDPVTGATMLPE